MKTKHFFLTLLALLTSITASADETWTDANGTVWNFRPLDKTAVIWYRGYNGGTIPSPCISGTIPDNLIIPTTVYVGTTPYTVTSIGQSAFYGCSSLTSITIPETVTSIYNCAFYGCSSLTSINIPDGVTILEGGSIFYGCSSLTSINIPDGITRIEVNTFYNCSSLTSITIPNSVTYFGEKAFYGCSSLTSINIPDGVTSIQKQTFYNCSSLTSITIPSSVTSIASDAFYNCCKGLTSISVAEGNTTYDSRNDCNAIIHTLSRSLMVGCMNTTIPSNVLSIYSNAFYKCTGLTSITIPSSVTSIGSSAFYGCSSLTSINIHEGVQSIGDLTFFNCSSLTSITIPSSVTSIESSAFRGCSGLTSISVAEGNTTYDSRDDCNAIIHTASHALMVGCNNTTIPSSVTSIGSYAFYNCKGLTSITIPSSVTSIGSSAFSGCTGLTSIAIPSSVTSIGSSAFYNCTGLTSISVAEGNTTYDSRNDCNAIINTNTNTLIVGCMNTTIPSSVTSIGSSAFSGCTGLTSIAIPSSVTSIGSSAFSGCTGLTSITIPSSVTSIGSYAFMSCRGLTSITIPSSVTSIGSQAFDYCTGLTSVQVDIETPLSISSRTFSNPANATLIVPIGSKTAYEAAQYWQDFGTIEELSSSKTIAVGNLGKATYCSPVALDFSGVSGIKAYIASGFNPKTGTLVLTRVTEVPAGEGLYIVGDEGSYNVPATTTAMFYSNLLKGVTTATTISPTDGDKTNFILANGTHGVGFYTLSDAGEIAAGKAYLQLPTASLSSNVKAINFAFSDDSETGINETKEVREVKEVYNLQGQRVSQPKHGLYIINGKKVIIK